MQDIPDLLEGLGRTPRILNELVRSIPESKLDARRGKNFWTIAEHVIHLARVQPMLLDRFKRFMNEEQPEFVPYLPATDEDAHEALAPMSMNGALEQFKHYRSEQMRLLQKADEAIWKRTAKHPEYDQYSFYILTRHTLMHDHRHMYRIEELWLTKDAYLTGME